MVIRVKVIRKVLRVGGMKAVSIPKDWLEDSLEYVVIRKVGDTIQILPLREGG